MPSQGPPNRKQDLGGIRGHEESSLRLHPGRACSPAPYCSPALCRPRARFSSSQPCCQAKEQGPQSAQRVSASREVAVRGTGSTRERAGRGGSSSTCIAGIPAPCLAPGTSCRLWQGPRGPHSSAPTPSPASPGDYPVRGSPFSSKHSQLTHRLLSFSKDCELELKPQSGSSVPWEAPPTPLLPPAPDL